MEIDNQQHKETIMMNERLENPDEIVLENVKELKNVDELFMDNVSVHYEVMGDDAIWFSFTHPNGQIDHFNIVRKGKKLSTLYSCNTGNMKGLDVEEPTIVPEHRY